MTRSPTLPRRPQPKEINLPEDPSPVGSIDDVIRPIILPAAAGLVGSTATGSVTCRIRSRMTSRLRRSARSSSEGTRSGGSLMDADSEVGADELTEEAP